MRIEIHEAHWQAIRERQMILQQMVAQFQMLRGEDKRHIDAVLLAAGHDPNSFQNYELAMEKDVFYLDATTKPPEQAASTPQGAAPKLVQPVNGTPQPLVSE